MQCVTAVDGHWLAELGPMFFSVKESTRTRLVREEGKICNSWLVSGTRSKIYHAPFPLCTHIHTPGEEASCQGEALTDGGRAGGSVRRTEGTKGRGEGQEDQERQVSQTTSWG